MRVRSEFIAACDVYLPQMRSDSEMLRGYREGEPLQVDPDIPNGQETIRIKRTYGYLRFETNGARMISGSFMCLNIADTVIFALTTGAPMLTGTIVNCSDEDIFN